MVEVREDGNPLTIKEYEIGAQGQPLSALTRLLSFSPKGTSGANNIR